MGMVAVGRTLQRAAAGCPVPRTLWSVEGVERNAEPEVDRGDPAGSFDSSGADPDPMERFRRWAELARTAGSRMADTAILATASPEGVPSARAVILRAFDHRGFVFFTNYESPKARDIQANPRGALVFLWPELHRQVRVSGPIERVSKTESEAYFLTRPPGHRLAAWASPQSRTIEDRRELEGAFEAARARFPGDEVPLPPFWGGFRVIPDSVEFWQGRENRLHDRVRYTRSAQGWRIERLAP
jgi:pyridoxamine 5'-phosphate oxidase